MQFQTNAGLAPAFVFRLRRIDSAATMELSVDSASKNTGTEPMVF
jgi:hypothetical protein